MSSYVGLSEEERDLLITKAKSDKRMSDLIKSMSAFIPYMAPAMNVMATHMRNQNFAQNTSAVGKTEEVLLVTQYPKSSVV